MTREVSTAANGALSDADLATIVPAFTFMKACAEWAGVPHAASWQLGYLADGIAPWRIIDRDADAGPSGTSNVAVTFQTSTVACLRIELEGVRQGAARPQGDPRPRLQPGPHGADQTLTSA